jgi:hypothetical protein
MTRIEKRIAASEASARSALEDLRPLVQPASRARLAEAVAALERFVDVNAQIMALSRRNTNVRSLAMSLNEKPRAAQACEETLRALRASLANHGYTSSRYDTQE